MPSKTDFVYKLSHENKKLGNIPRITKLGEHIAQGKVPTQKKLPKGRYQGFLVLYNLRAFLKFFSQIFFPALFSKTNFTFNQSQPHSSVHILREYHNFKTFLYHLIQIQDNQVVETSKFNSLLGPLYPMCGLGQK